MDVLLLLDTLRFFFTAFYVDMGDSLERQGPRSCSPPSRLPLHSLAPALPRACPFAPRALLAVDRYY